MYTKEIKRINDYIEKGTFKDNWDSLSNYEVPKWYKSAKFGIFSHFGPYTVPEFGHDWYVHGMYTKDDFVNKHHVKTYGNLKEYGYKHLVKEFSAKNFDQSKWLDLIKKSGAKYYVPVAEHHDGFQMYKSKISKWNAYEMGPKKDIIKLLKEESESNNINFGLSTHRAEHWFFLEPGLLHDTDVHDAEFGDLYWPTKPKTDIGKDPILTQLYLDDWLVRTIELIDNFKPRVLYFDFWIEHEIFRDYTKKILAYYYNTMLNEYGDCGVVNYKHDAIPFNIAVRDVERGQFDKLQRDYWQGCTSSVHGAWIYTKNNDFKMPEDLCKTLIDVVSKNGNLLLNIGPKADGTICDQEVNILTSIGNWLDINGEAIFDTTPYKIFGEGDNNVPSGDFNEGRFIDYTHTDIRFTCKSNKIYCFIMNPRGVKSFKINTLGLEKKEFKKNNTIKNVSVLGELNVVEYSRESEYLEVTLDKSVDTIYPICIKVEVL